MRKMSSRDRKGAAIASRTKRTLRDCFAAMLLATTALGLSGCMLLGPNYQRPDIKLPSFFSLFGGQKQEVAAAPPLSVPADWWRLYQDKTLDDLVTAGLRNNADLQRAVARVEEAEA